MHVFTLDGRKISTYSPYSSLSSSPSTPLAPIDPSSLSSTEQSRLKKSLSSYIGLGIRVVEWNKSGEFLAIGGYDGRVRVLSRAVGFENVVSELSCPNKVIGGKKERTVSSLFYFRGGRETRADGREREVNRLYGENLIKVGSRILWEKESFLVRSLSFSPPSFRRTR